MSTLACTSGDAPIDAAGASGAILGRVNIQLVHDHDSGAQHSRAEAVFVRWRGLAENTVGTALALPGFGVSELKPGECRVFDQAAAMGDAAGGRADIQLLDAGDIVVETPARLFPLPPRRYADILPTLTGFMYEATTELDAAERYEVRGSGGEELSFFRASAPAPRDIRLVGVGGRDAADGILLDRARNQIVRLDGTADDVFVELSVGPVDARISLRCRAQGPAVELPAVQLAELPRGDAVLAAVRAVSAQLRGVPSRGELWVEYRDELQIGLR